MTFHIWLITFLIFLVQFRFIFAGNCLGCLFGKRDREPTAQHNVEAGPHEHSPSPVHSASQIETFSDAVEPFGLFLPSSLIFMPKKTATIYNI